MSVLDPAAYSFSLYAVPMLLTMVAILLLGLLDFGRDRVTPISSSFFAVTLAVSIWLLGTALSYMARDAALGLWLSRASYLGVPFIPASTYGFTVTVLHIYRHVRVFVWLAWLAGAFFCVAALGTNWLVRGVYSYPWGYYAAYGWLGAFLVAFFGLMLLASQYHYWRVYRVLGPGKRRRRIGTLMSGFVVGYIGVVDFVPAYGVALYPFGYLAVLGFVILLARAIWTYRLDDITPALAAGEIIDTMSNALLVLDPDGVIRVANQAAAELFGYSVAELTGAPLAIIGSGLFPVSVADLLRLASVPRYEVEYRARQGTALTLDLATQVKRNRRGSPVAVVCVIRDISADKRAEQEIRALNEDLEGRVAERTAQLAAANRDLAQEVAERQQAEAERARLLEQEQAARRAAELAGQRSAQLAAALDRALAETRLLNSIAGAAAGQEDMDVILRAALDNLRLVMPFAGGSIALVEGDALVVRAAAGPFAATVLGTQLPRGRGKSWEIVTQMAPFMSGDLARAGLSANSPVRSFLGVPLIWAGAAFGLLEVDSPAPDSFSATDLELLQKVAAALSGSIQLARVHGQVRGAMRQELRRAAQLRSLAGAAVSINSMLSLDEMLQEITRQARETIGAHVAVANVWGARDAAEKWTAVALSDKYAAWRDLAAQPRSENIAALFGDNRPVRLTDAEMQTHPRLHLIADADGRRPPRGWLAVPLISRDGQHHGLIELSDKYEGEFSAEDDDILLQLAQMAAVAIENARLYRESEDAVREREVLLSVVSHDLRNLLTAVKTSATLLRRFLRGVSLPQNEQIEASLGRIDGAVLRMNSLIAALLDFARLQAGQSLELNRRRCDLVALARRLAEEQQQGTDRHQITVSSEVDELQGLWDAARLERALDNLLGNAIKYSPRGGEINVELAQDAAGDTALLTVRDQGIGIPEADLPDVFQWFHRAGNVTGRISGTGIGLVSVAQVVEQHGGTISVSSSENTGTAFTIRLPRYPQPSNGR